MTTKLWTIESNRLKQLEPNELDLEKELENWLSEDIRLLSESLLVIGRQVGTDSGGTIDILALDRQANLVVVELKKGKTAREVVAQTLDYASSIQEYGLEKVKDLTQHHLQKDLEEAFESKFGSEGLPETVNDRQRMYIVASSFDNVTSRVVEYLSRTYGIDINIVSFSYFKTDTGEFVLRSSFLREEDVQKRANAASRKKFRAATEQELREIASNEDVVDLWDLAVEGFSKFCLKIPSKTTLCFSYKTNEGRKALLTIFPGESSREKGLAISIVFDHVLHVLKIEDARVQAVCGTRAEKAFHGSYSTMDNCFHFQMEQLKALIDLMHNPDVQ